MEIIPGIHISIDMIVSLMIKISMVLLSILGLVAIRQESLMDKVVDLPIGKNLKLLAWGYFVTATVLTVIVLLA